MTDNPLVKYYTDPKTYVKLPSGGNYYTETPEMSVDGEIGVLVQGSRVFSPLTLDRGTNVARYGEGDELVLSGIVWEEAKPQLANKAYLMHQPMGRGQVIAFAEDPNYRAYTASTMLLFMNAVLLGPGR